MRLPRARSTPSSRQWMLNPAASAAAAEPSLGRAAPQRSDAPSSFSNDFGGHCGAGPSSRLGTPSSRHGASTPGAQRPYNAGRHRVKADLASALDTRNEVAQLRRLRQVTGANQFNREMSADLGKARRRSSELSHVEAPGPPLSETCEKALLGIEKTQALDGVAGAKATPRDQSMPRTTTRESTPAASEPKKRLSLRSEEAMKQLAVLDARLLELEAQVSELNQHARQRNGPASETVGQMRTTLAQLEAEANKLESKGVDCVYTSELGSGQAAAKDLKKALLQRLEKIFAFIEELFHHLASKTI